MSTRILLASIATGAILTASVLASPPAESAPGQCGNAIVFGSGGGFCDYPPAADGTWLHCETVYVLGFGGTNCFRVRPVPVDVDSRGWVPA